MLEDFNARLRSLLRVLLAISAVGVAIGGLLMVIYMDASSASQGGRVFVGIGAVVLFAVIIGKYRTLR